MSISEVPSTMANATPVAMSRGIKVNLGSVIHARRQNRTDTVQPCKSLSYSLEELNLSSASPIQTLASLRFLVLSHLADLERRLSDCESPSIEEATQWARTALEMLEGIRADVCSHFPDFQFTDLSTLESFVKSLSDLPDVSNLTEMRSHLPDMPHLPGMAEMRSHLPDLPHMDNVRSQISDMRLKLDDVRTRFHEIDIKKLIRYIPQLTNHLKNLHTHLSSMELSSGLPVASSTHADLLDALLSSDIVFDILNSTPDAVEADALIERTACEVTNAIKSSLDGRRLITYSELPIPWRSNAFIVHGYR